VDDRREQFEWLRCPEAEAYVGDCLARFAAAMPPVRALQAGLTAHTTTRLADWLDHVVLADGDRPRGQLADLGFEPEGVQAAPGNEVLFHPGAIFPRLVLRAGTGAPAGTVLAAALLVEDVAEFLMAQHVAAPIEGTVLGPYRRASVWRSDGRALLAVERRGHGGFVPLAVPPDHALRVLEALEQWATRPRQFDDRRKGMERTLELARALAGDLGADLAAWLAFAAERAHWQRRNWAGQVQRARQDRLGLGWANHDHHTFRSSRDVFPLLIQTLEALGFRPREAFYAGAEAGWGAQVMEQPACRFVVFADVDLAPGEVEGDFAHEPLAPRNELGSVGLWCALHGESMLAAGLHHLAARLDFDAAMDALPSRGAAMMRPFSDFAYLRQAFSRGERWEVAGERVERLVAAGQLDAAQAERIARDGTVGSHLENIQRGEGFKGFNQQTVSDIIRRTDPRTEPQVE
jgi:hypothetical protein